MPVEGIETVEDGGEETLPMKEFFVYALLDPRTDEVFYVGMGQGRRPEDHEKQARSAIKSLEDEGRPTESAKIARLREIMAQGSTKTRVIGRYGTAAEAFAVETALIHWMYGKKNLTNIQSGHGSRFIRNHGDLDVRTWLDIPEKVGRDNSGEYTERHRKQSERDGDVPYLEALRHELLNEGLSVRDFDGADPVNPRIWVELPTPFCLAVAAKRETVTVYVMAADRTAKGVRAFHEAYETIAGRIADQVHNPKDPYFALLTEPRLPRHDLEGVVREVVQGVKNFEMLLGSR